MKKKKIPDKETKHLSTNADSSTDTTVGWTKNTRKPFFFRRKMVIIIQNLKAQKHLEICPNERYTLWPEVSNPSWSVVSKISYTPFDHGEAWLPPCFVRQNHQKKICFVFRCSYPFVQIYKVFNNNHSSCIEIYVRSIHSKYIGNVC